MKKGIFNLFLTLQIAIPVLALCIFSVYWIAGFTVQWKVVIVLFVTLIPGLIIFFIFNQPIMRALGLAHGKDVWGWPYPRGLSIELCEELVWIAVFQRKHFHGFLVYLAEGQDHEEALKQVLEMSNHKARALSKKWRK